MDPLNLQRIWFFLRENEKGSPVQARRYPRSCKRPPPASLGAEGVKIAGSKPL